MASNSAPPAPPNPHNANSARRWGRLSVADLHSPEAALSALARRYSTEALEKLALAAVRHAPIVALLECATAMSAGFAAMARATQHLSAPPKVPSLARVRGRFAIASQLPRAFGGAHSSLQQLADAHPMSTSLALVIEDCQRTGICCPSAHEFALLTVIACPHRALAADAPESRAETMERNVRNWLRIARERRPDRMLIMAMAPYLTMIAPVENADDAPPDSAAADAPAIDSMQAAREIDRTATPYSSSTPITAAHAAFDLRGCIPDEMQRLTLLDAALKVPDAESMLQGDIKLSRWLEQTAADLEKAARLAPGTPPPTIKDLSPAAQILATLLDRMRILAQSPAELAPQMRHYLAEAAPPTVFARARTGRRRLLAAAVCATADSLKRPRPSAAELALVALAAGLEQHYVPEAWARALSSPSLESDKAALVQWLLKLQRWS